MCLNLPELSLKVLVARFCGHVLRMLVCASDQQSEQTSSQQLRSSLLTRSCLHRASHSSIIGLYSKHGNATTMNDASLVVVAITSSFLNCARLGVSLGRLNSRVIRYTRLKSGCISAIISRTHIVYMRV